MSGSEKLSYDQLFQSAMVLMENNEYHHALPLLERARLENDQDLRLWRALKICYSELGDVALALECARHILRKKSDAESFYELGECLELNADDEGAREAYLQALYRLQEASPLLFQIYKNLGNIEVRNGDFDAAEECYHKAHTLDPESDTLYVNYGVLEIQRQSWAQAQQRFQTALCFNPNNERAWLGLGICYRFLGDRELARANVSRALDIGSKDNIAESLLRSWDQEDFVKIPSLRESLGDQLGNAQAE